MKSGLFVGLLMVLGAASSSLHAADVIESKGLNIYGMSELPNGLTLLSWRREKPDVVLDRVVFSMPDGVFSPVERGAFLRQVEYYRQVFAPQAPKK